MREDGASAKSAPSLYVDPRSSACLRVLAWQRHKGLDLPLHRVDILAGEHRDPARAPIFATRSVPVLALGPDGPWLSQSLAILLHLEAAFPEPPTLPADAAARSQVLEALVARGAPGDYAVGDRVTLADFFLWPALRNAVRGGVALGHFSRLDALFQRYATLDCFIAVVPEG